jgi:hypothetical protein
LGNSVPISDVWIYLYVYMTAAHRNIFRILHNQTSVLFAKNCL